MIGNEKLIETLNDLILINNDRIGEYEKTIKSIQSTEDISFIQKMIAQSTQFKNELINEIKSKTNKVDWKSYTKSGNIYKVWKAIKPSKTQKRNLSISGFSVFLENAILRSYKEALSPDVYMPSDTTQLMIMQQAKLKKSFELLHDKSTIDLVNS